MRLRRTLRNEHAGGDFGVRIALGRQHHGLALAVGQRVEQGARLINASSAATYGDGSHGFSDSLLTTLSLRPLNMYGYSKQMFDLWAYRENLLKSIASVKFFNVYGPNEYHKGEMKSVACKAFTELRETGSLRLFKSDRPQYPRRRPDARFRVCEGLRQRHVLAAGASRSQRHPEHRFG